MSPSPIRILVVDDSALYRQSIDNVLREIADVSIVGTAKNGVEALEKVEKLDPDLLTLDVQMPDVDGIQVLDEIRRCRFRAKAIMVSSFTSAGADVTTDALMKGAFDFILKPSSKDAAANREQLRDALNEKIVAFRESIGRRQHRKRRTVAQRDVGADTVVESAPAPSGECQAVMIATSTGGPAALKAVLSKLNAELAAPVLVVQHMPAQYTKSLAARLDTVSELAVVEAADKTEVMAGKVIVAPGGKQMKLERDGSSLIVRVNNDPPENGVRPSADYLIRSAADVLRGNALAVIMTGMGRDGLAGCRRLKEVGGFVFAQSQEDCIVYGMPKVVIDAGLADRALPLGKIAPAIKRHINRSRRS